VRIIKIEGINGNYSRLKMNVINTLFAFFMFLNIGLSQNIFFDKEAAIKNILGDKYFQSIKLFTDFKYDTIKSREVNSLNFWNLKTYTTSNIENPSMRYKPTKLSESENLIYFKNDTIVGVIYQYRIDTSIWIGKTAYKNISKKRDSYLYAGYISSFNEIKSSENIILGFENYNLFLYSKTPVTNERSKLEIDGNNYLTNIIRLDSLFRFVEIQISDDEDIPAITVYKNSHPLNSNYIDNYRMRLVGIGCYFLIEKPKKRIWDLNINEIKTHFSSYWDSSYPFSFREIKKEKLDNGKLNPYVMWLYDDAYYLMPR
jgi:hypothetical protein